MNKLTFPKPLPTAISVGGGRGRLVLASGQAGEQAGGEDGDAGQGTVHAGLFDTRCLGRVSGSRHEMMFL